MDLQQIIQMLRQQQAGANPQQGYPQGGGTVGSRTNLRDIQAPQQQAAADPMAALMRGGATALNTSQGGLAGLLRGGAQAAQPFTAQGAAGAIGQGVGNTIGAMAPGGAAPSAAAAGIGGGSGGGMLGALGPVGAALGATMALDQSGISPWKDTLRGKAPSNIVDAAGLNQGAAGKALKGATDLMGMDIGGFAKNSLGAIGDLFKLKLF